MRINSSQFNINFDSLLPITKKIKKGIFFAGGGGWSCGLKDIKEIEIRWILNHDRTALRTSAFHNKGTKVFWSDVYVQDEKEMEPVEVVQGSLECDDHTDANTEEEKDPRSYTMGWEFYRYLPHLNPLVISIENVPAFKRWAPLDEDNKPIKARAGEEFERWKNAIMDLGYEYKESIRNAADDGLPTRRVRFFCFFYRPGIEINFPEHTHSENGENGKYKWLSCREHIDTSDTGVSIFGREFNMDLRKNLRRPLVKNSLKRIAGGIKKQHPGLYQFLCKYHGGDNPERSYSLDKPIHTIDTSNRHQLVTITNGQFIQDHCQTDNYQGLDSPLRTQLTWQTKQLVTLEYKEKIAIEKLRFIMDYCVPDNKQKPEQQSTLEANDPFIVQYYGGSIQSNSLDDPINTIPCRDTHQLVMVEKLQFIAKYFNSNGHPEINTESLDTPLSPVLTTNKHQLVTILEGFDIKVRFLNKEELAACSTFPRDYFSHPELKLSGKAAIELIGNAVPPKWAEVLIKPNVQPILRYRAEKLSA